MAITYAITTTDTATYNSASPLTSGSVSVTADDIIVLISAFPEVNPAGNVSISNTGTALTWNLIYDTGDHNYTNPRAGAWWAKALTTQSITISTAWDSGSALEVEQFIIVHTGAHLTDPCPSGKVYSGISGTDVSQSITPTASGSALWMIAAGAADSSTFAAITNCTASTVGTPPDNHSVALIRPSTQPRTDGAAFTIGETDTGDTVAWVAFEVKAAGGSSFNPAWTRNANQVIQ